MNSDSKLKEEEDVEVHSPPSKRSILLKKIGAAIAVMIALTVGIMSLVYYKEIEEVLKGFAGIIKENPVVSTVIIFIVYTIGVPLQAPITLVQLMLGYTYSLVFESQIKGLIFATILV